MKNAISSIGLQRKKIERSPKYSSCCHATAITVLLWNNAFIKKPNKGELTVTMRI